MSSPAGTLLLYPQFTAWMDKHGPFDVILDGANAGFLNQNFAGGGFSHAQVDAVLRELQARHGRVLLILHSRWFDASTDLKPWKRKRGRKVKLSVRAHRDAAAASATSAEGHRATDCAEGPEPEGNEDAVSTGSGSEMPVKRRRGDGVAAAAAVGGGNSGAEDNGGSGDEARSQPDSAAASSCTETDCAESAGEDEDDVDESTAKPTMNPLCERWQAESIVYPVQRGTTHCGFDCGEAASLVVMRWLPCCALPGNNDDWYWLYAAVYQGEASQVSVVTNDQMRDHHFNMLAPRYFLKWRERHQVKMDVKPSRSHASGYAVTLKYPSQYSHRVQPAVDGSAWYFPVTGTAATWFVAWQQKPELAAAAELSSVE